ncbi:hypothetical protein EBZ35_07335 [bacterium]|nr:hypothetical protein [bacterium]
MDPSFPHWLTEAAHHLSSGRIGIVPTDTILGLSATVTTAHAARLNHIKGRSPTHPLVVLVSGWAMARTVACLPNDSTLAWPGPVTYICHTTPTYQAILGPTVALRYPMGWWIRGIMDLIQAPLFSTSVNATGDPPITHVAHIPRQIQDQVAFCITEMATYRTHPSTIIDVTCDHPVIRRHA